MIAQPKVETTIEPGGVGVVTFGEPPNNYLNICLLTAIIDGLTQLDAHRDCRVTLLRSEGRHFCAGRDFSAPREAGDSSELLYGEAARLFRLTKPWVALVQGGAIGSGFGLAVAADFRIATSTAYFHPNFVKVGIHHGFGLSLTLPAVVGEHRARRMLYLGDRVPAAAAGALGLADVVLEPHQDLLAEGRIFTGRLASLSPAALAAIRKTCRQELTEERYRAAVAHESAEQSRLQASREETREPDARRG